VPNCQWKYVKRGYEPPFWETECGHYHPDRWDTSSIKFCPYCGKWPNRIKREPTDAK
jgi:hypothetical protein